MKATPSPASAASATEPAGADGFRLGAIRAGVMALAAGASLCGCDDPVLDAAGMAAFNPFGAASPGAVRPPPPPPPRPPIPKPTTAPTAGFTFAPASATAGKPVTFTNASTGATSWSWSFGDGGRSALKSPSHTFATAGTYTVTQVATNAKGSTSASKSITVAAATPSLPDPGNCPQAAKFVDVSLRANYIDMNGDGKTNADKGGAALNPSLAVSCDTTRVTVVSNGTLNFDYVNIGPTGQTGTAPNAVNNKTFMFPKTPAMAAKTTAIPLLGAVAVTVTGVQIFGPNEAGVDSYADPFLHGLLDYCGGHVTQYHFHSFPECFFNQKTVGGKAGLLADKTADVVVGYAFDGFPIKSPYVCADAACTSVKELKSSFVYSGTNPAKDNAWTVNKYIKGAGDLDECNGYTDSKGQYAYHVTRTFPYWLACYKGTPTTNR